jgi:serine/threonine-protein kinase
VHEASRFPRPFGKYLLLRHLATGGMAEVYLARANGPAGWEKECVIKRILPALAADQQFVQMFLDEARIAARLNHPNIVQIFDLGQVGPKEFFIAMEFVHGVDVEQVLDAEKQRGGRVPLHIACRVVASIAEGLDHAHRAVDGRGHPLGLVHRDVSPSNVMVSFDGTAKILDFGIAKAAPLKGRTEVGVIKGKIPYMSPEQVEGLPLDARSDVFSLGTLLYELIAGVKPFDGNGPAEVSLQILQKEVSAAPLMWTGQPDALFTIIRRAHAKDRETRYQSGRELQLALEMFLAKRSMACTSHDIACYVEELFPGMKERVLEDVSQVPPVEAHDPTVPVMETPRPTVGSLAVDGESDGPAPILGDLSSHQLGNYEDVRRNLGGGGRGFTFIIVFLVIAVAAGFYILRRSNSDEADAKAAVAQPAKSAVAEPAKPAVAEPAKPEPAKPAVAEPAMPAVAEPAKPESAKPAVAEPPKPAVAEPAKPAVAEPAKHEPPKPVAAKHEPARPAKPAKPHAEPPKALPHLPTPPPPDDNPN